MFDDLAAAQAVKACPEIARRYHHWNGGLVLRLKFLDSLSSSAQVTGVIPALF